MSLSPAPFDETSAPRLTRRRLLAALLALGLLPVLGPPGWAAMAATTTVPDDGWLLAPGDR